MQNKIILTVGSMTYAIKARKTLNRNDIPSKLVKIDESKVKGCAYGIEIDDTKLLSAVSALKENGIQYSLYERRGR